MMTSDDNAGKKGPCLTCGHEVHVPHLPKKRQALSMAEREKKAKAELALINVAMDSSGDAAELIKEKAGWFIPVYDELSLFLTAATLILLYVVNTTMRIQIHLWLAQHNDVWVYIIGTIFLCGLFLSVYHVFTTREKTEAEKWGMLIFAVLANAITGIVAGLYVLKSNEVRGWQLVFPIWNIINSALLILMLRFKIIDEECISDRDATAVQTILGLAAVLVIFAICNFVFKLHWAVTFSICIVYTTSFDRALQNVFPGLTNRMEETSAPF
jgi:hypothetical protein